MHILVFPVVPFIAVMVTGNLNESLVIGQTGSVLTCAVSGADNLNSTIIITYQWTRNGGITLADQPDQGNSSFLYLSPIRLSHAGDYTCNVNVYRSALFISTVSATNSQIVMIQGKFVNLFLCIILLLILWHIM